MKKVQEHLKLQVIMNEHNRYIKQRNILRDREREREREREKERRRKREIERNKERHDMT